jgi:hypothetical protein
MMLVACMTASPLLDNEDGWCKTSPICFSGGSQSRRYNANDTFLEDFIYQNLMIQPHLIDHIFFTFVIFTLLFRKIWNKADLLTILFFHSLFILQKTDRFQALFSGSSF